MFGNIMEIFTNAYIRGEAFILIAVLLSLMPVYFIVNKLLVPNIIKFVSNKKSGWKETLEARRAFNQLSYIIPIILFMSASLYFSNFYAAIARPLEAALVMAMTMFIANVIGASNALYELSSVSKDKPLKSYTQLSIILVYVIGSILTVCELTDTSPDVFLGGAVAVMAAILLVFRDTILSFVTSMQLAANHLLKKGDWVEMPSFGANGVVIDMALHVIRIQNFDKTISVVPTSKILESGFKNWQGMVEAGARRIKRAIYIDQKSIAFMDKKAMQALQKNKILSPFLSSTADIMRAHDVDSESLLINLSVFRSYIKEYLDAHPHLNQTATKLVRMMDPTPDGLPLEIYAYTKDTSLMGYESVQADIFEHLIAVMPLFGLRLFQNPMDTDIDTILKIRDM